MDGIALAPIGALLLVACLIAMLTRRLGLPYIVGLVVAGFLIALLPHSPELPLSRALIFNVLLPPLVFEAALQLSWPRFRRELPLTLVLAFAGVAIAAAVVAAGMHYLVGWSWIGAALFGVLIAATDPVSVIAAFRDMRCQPRLSMVVEAESLLNDGIAAVGFAVLSAIAAGASPHAASILPAFLWTLGGGLAIGLGLSGAILIVAGRTDDPLVEISLTTIAAYGSFLLAEHFGGEHIIYCGDYLDTDHEYFSFSKDQLLERFLPSLARFNPDFKPEWVRESWLFRTPYAQPVPEVNHSRNIPPIRTPLPGLYFASMSQVYPWDRGTNFAVQIGRKAARLMLGS